MRTRDVTASPEGVDAGLGGRMGVKKAATVTTWQFFGTRLLARAFAGAVIPFTLVYIGDTIEYGRRYVVLGGRRFNARAYGRNT